MNQETEQTPGELFRQSPFWVCLLVFLVLSLDNGIRLDRMVEQRQQLDELRLNQSRILAQMGPNQPQLEATLKAVSIDLLELGKTNAPAQQIVQEFKIVWMPGPAAENSPAGK